MAEELGAVAGIDNGNVAVAFRELTVIVRAYHEVHAFQGIEEVQPLGFKNLPVAVAGCRVHRNYHHLRLFLGGDAVDIFLHFGNKALEMHAAP